MGMSTAQLMSISIVGLALLGTSPTCDGKKTSGPAQADSGPTVVGKKQLVMTDKPTTVTVQVDRDTAGNIEAALSRSRNASVRLLVDGVTPPENRDLVTGFRVFVNKPDATDATPVEDPHYVGAVEFQPSGSSKSQSFALDLGPALSNLKQRKQLRLDQPLRLTFLVTIAEGKPKPRRIELQFQNVTVSLPPEKH